MKNLNLSFLAFVLFAAILSSCNLSGQAPAGMRYQNGEAYIPKDFLNESLLADDAFLWNKKGERFSEIQADANNDGTTDSYVDALGSTKVMGIKYTFLDDLIRHPENYRYAEVQNAKGGISYKFSVSVKSEFVLTDQQPNSSSSTGVTATEKYAVEVTR